MPNRHLMWIYSPIHTYKVDRGILPAVKLYSDGGTPLLSEYDNQWMQPIGCKPLVDKSLPTVLYDRNRLLYQLLSSKTGHRWIEIQSVTAVWLNFDPSKGQFVASKTDILIQDGCAHTADIHMQILNPETKKVRYNS